MAEPESTHSRPDHNGTPIEALWKTIVAHEPVETDLGGIAAAVHTVARDIETEAAGAPDPASRALGWLADRLLDVERRDAAQWERIGELVRILRETERAQVRPAAELLALVELLLADETPNHERFHSLGNGVRRALFGRVIGTLRTGRIGEDELAAPPAEQDDWLLTMWQAARAIEAQGNQLALARADIETGTEFKEGGPAESLFDIAFHLDHVIRESEPRTWADCVAMARAIWLQEGPGGDESAPEPETAFGRLTRAMERLAGLPAWRGPANA